MIFPDDKARRIFESASMASWSVEHACHELSELGAVARPIRAAMAGVYGTVLQAERLGLAVATRVVELAPEGWLRDFGRLQWQDEGKHVAFFGHVCQQLGGHEPTTETLDELRRQLEYTRTYDELMVHAQVLESAAHTLFMTTTEESRSQMRRALRLRGTTSLEALLRVVAEDLGRDEAHHIAFGKHYLRTRVREQTRAVRRDWERSAQHTGRLVVQTFEGLSSEYGRLGLSPGKLTAHLAHNLRVHFESVGLELDLSLPTLPVGTSATT